MDRNVQNGVPSARSDALIVKRNIRNQDIIASTHVEINSQSLSRVLQDVFPDSQSLGLDKEKPEVTCEILWHASPALRQRLDQERAKKGQTRDDVIISDIEGALALVQKEYATTTSQLTALSEKGLISYDLLWCLFPPRVEVYTDVNALHEPQILRCKSFGYHEDQQTGEKWFAIQSECLNHDSQGFGWSEQLLKISSFKGTAHITSLLAHPLAYHPKEKDLRGRLHARGKTFVGLLAQPTCRQHGAMALISRRAGSEWDQETLHISGRVMVDPSRFPKLDSSSDPLRKPSCPRSKAFSPAETPDKDLMFCHYRIIGFSFDQKKWSALAVSQLRDPEWNDKALDRVMMPPGKRELLRSLVSAHRAEDERHGGPDDVSKDKGRGLAGLLSGPPGVGKTLTAEAVAEISRRPLYAVSAGELGAEGSDVERRLGKVFAAASSWKCVLLVEDCDVFLRRRDHVSLINSALVSIFLRRLESFQGLAILTTNRIEDIDKALLTRLHFKIHYGDLGSKQRLALWKSFLGLVKSLDEGKLQKIATDHEVNGHEIKNAVSCAKLIAQSRGCTFTADLLEEILDELSPRSNNIKNMQDLPATFQEVSCNKKDGSDNRNEALTRRILDNDKSFGANQALRLATPDQVAKANQALDSLAGKVTLVYSGSGDLNIQFGNGDMFHVNSGGTVNKAEHMAVGHKPTSTR
ncbi:hypothetical protein INS49_005750 [Diaporthe citri]|uniref:uncharacterized protein n=1 Tax=Diaporthe citri TaxID=83186 RepID=UPI001C7E5569|nr:uncharacterized protein INS49_005750 [Diaporthe citri]KAG6364152.1 hypothetical protein INS49_005750 [Diaporthe citri]